MTRRQRLLVRYLLGSAAVLLLIVGGVWLAESLRAPSDETEGIDDILARELPADAPRVRYVDATAGAGIRFRHFPATRTHLLPEDMGSGLAWGDCDGDGLHDLYVVNIAAPLSSTDEDLAAATGDRLYRNRGNGTFEDISAVAGADLRHFGMGASWGDYDGDGDLDLYVSSYGANSLLRNEGACTFTDVTTRAGVSAGDAYSAGTSWGDYDGDGDLDLYVTNYVVFPRDQRPTGAVSQQFGQVVPFTLNPAAFEPAPNVLFRNDGDGTFSDVTDDAGVADREGRSLSAAWCDFDEDGDLDLYVANDVSDNVFYLNLGDNTFENVSAASMTGDYRGAMGLAVADYDNDSDVDFFVTHWIAQENGLYENHLDAELGAAPFFTDVADLVGLGATALRYVGWGTSFLDIDNDGWKDLFVANGHTVEDHSDPTRLVPQQMLLFWNRGEAGFYDMTPAAGPPFSRLLVARGAAAADYDGDGDMDLAVLEHGGSLLLMANNGQTTNHWAQFDLRQPGHNRLAIGARITLEAGGVRTSHAVGASASYLSQDALTAHFGLGAAERIDSVQVRWPDGTVQEWTNLEADRRVTLERAAPGSEP